VNVKGMEKKRKKERKERQSRILKMKETDVMLEKVSQPGLHQVYGHKIKEVGQRAGHAIHDKVGTCVMIFKIQWEFLIFFL